MLSLAIRLAVLVGVSGWQMPTPRFAASRPAQLQLPRPLPNALRPVMEEEGVRAGLVTEVPFEIRFSIGNLITVSGGALLLYSVGAYLFNNGQADLVQTLGFVYAIPALVRPSLGILGLC